MRASLLITTLCTLWPALAGAVAPPPVSPPLPPSGVPRMPRRPPAIPARPLPAPRPPRAQVPAGPPPAILPLAEVRPGMVGEALTVFQGTKPEPFKVKVVAILRQFLPKQDVILIRAEDPRVEFSGIVAGMSGSPVYVGGKLMGAVAYAWSFSKEPLGGVTPIESMLAERARPRRTRSELATATDPDGLRWLTAVTGGPASAGGRIPLGARPSTASTAAAGQPATGHLVRAAVPLAVSGFAPRALAEFAREIEPEGLLPVQAGGGRRRAGDKEPGRVEPGSAIGVELVRGDMSMVGTGTVTWVDRDGVLAFGHPMFGAGEIYLPLVDAEIHAILPSVSQSMKLSSPLHEVGALIQDRQSCIIGDLGARATMVPISVRVTTADAAPRVFRAEVARNQRLTAMLASLVVGSALSDAEPDVADMVVSVDSKISIKGHPALDLTDELFSHDGISRSSLGGTRGMRAVADLLANPFEPVVLDRLEFAVTIGYRRDLTEIVGVSLPGDAVRAGETVPLRVSLRPYAGPEYVQTVPVVLPAALGGDVARIEVASGGLAKPDVPPVESLGIYLDNLSKYYSPSSIVVSVQTNDESAALRGRLLPDLPAAAADTLRPSGLTRRAEAYRVTTRVVVPTQHLVFGKQEIAVPVRDDVVGERVR